MKKAKIVLSSVLAVSMAFGLAACGGSGDSKPAETQAAGSDAAATGEEVEFTWMHHLQEDGKKQWVQYCVDTYMAEHPNVKINIEILSADEYSKMLKTKAGADDAPMIFDADATTFPEYVKAGYTADVTDASDYEGFADSTLAQGQIDGVQYGVPLDMNAYCIFYNKQIFEDNNIEIPTTPEELKNVCQTLLDNGIQPFSTGFSEQWCLRRFVDYVDIMRVQDDSNWYVDKMDGTTNFADDQGFKDAMNLMVSYKPYWGNDPFGETWADVQNNIATGKAAMTINGSWITSGVQSIDPDARLGAFPIPVSDDQSKNVIYEKPGNCFCVFNSDDEVKLAAAKDFFNFMCSKDSAEHYATYALGLTGCVVDVDAGECINEINQYIAKGVYVQAGITTFSSEYDSAFKDDLVKYINVDTFNIDDLCKGLDEDFASIQ